MKIPSIFLLTAIWMIGQGLSLDSRPTDSFPFPSLTTTNDIMKSKAQFPQQAQKQGELLSVSHLLQHPEDYHQHIIRLRGTVTRLELHLDTTHHFIDFVFFIKQGKDRVLVFGRHDRTKGDIQLTSDRMVEVQGIFWKERFANEHMFTNNLEAQAVWFYPPLQPDQATRSIREKNA